MASQSGTWIDASAEKLLKNKNVFLAIAMLSSQQKKIVDPLTGICYYGVKGVRRVWGQRPDKRDTYVWGELIRDSAPDCIMVWGSEFANGLSVLAAAGNIPVLFYIQGVLGRIINYPMGLLSRKELFKQAGLLPWMKSFYFERNRKAQKKQCFLEAEMIRLSQGIISDNEWANSYYRLNTPDVTIYHSPLAVNEVFLDKAYIPRKRMPHTLFTVDGRNPAKGIFHLLKALVVVKQKYPDVKLYIPGSFACKKPAVLFESPYCTYLRKFIKKFDLDANVEFCGRLTSEEMKEKIDTCSVFVMPSAVENHSASLREAMYAGAPCISALVGSVDEYAQYEKNVLTYRYEESDVLAVHIMRLFADPDFAENIGREAWQSIRLKYPLTVEDNTLYEIYSEILGLE